MFKKATNPLGENCKELWKPITANPSYLVSNLGRVKSLKDPSYTNGRYMTLSPTVFGYLGAALNSHKVVVHRLVAKAFVPNPFNKPFVNHKDCNKMNNCVTNLEWVTQKENAEHAQQNQRYLPTTGQNHWTAKDPSRRKKGELNGRAVLTEKDVIEIRCRCNLSLQEIANIYGVTKQTISLIKKRKLWKHVS